MEGHHSMILDKGEERLIIQIQCQTIMAHDTSHPSEEDHKKKHIARKVISGARGVIVYVL